MTVKESPESPAASELNLLRQQLERIEQLLAFQEEKLRQSQRTDLAAGAEQLTQSMLPVHHLLRRLERKLQQQVRHLQRLEALRDVSALVNSSLDLAEVLNLCMDSIVRLTGAERAFLMLYDRRRELAVRTARNVDRKTIASSEFSYSRSIVQRVAETGEAVVATDARDDPRFAGQKSVISFNLRSILCVPLKVKSLTIGVIYADNRATTNIFQPEDRDLLMAYADQAAIALENARLFHQVNNHLADIIEMKHLMDDVFASIPSGVITINATDRITLINQAAAEILGIDGAGIHEWGHRQALAMLQPQLASLIAAARTTGGAASVEMDIARDGRRSTLLITCAPLRDGHQEASSVTLVVNDISQQKRLDSVRRYLPPALVDQIVDLDIAQQPERRRISTLFADVRNFTAVGERLAPELLVRRINVYLTLAAEAINAHEGVIDKFMGDGVMATFNTSLNPQVGDHCARSVRTALSLRAAVAGYHEQIPEDERLYFGIGIHAGEAVVGNIGSPFRKDYSAVGDAVNLAKRLQEIAEPNQILITAEVFEAVRAWVDAEPLGAKQLKNRQEAVQVFALLGERAAGTSLTHGSTVTGPRM
jgi:PAS domain S-box-containing protein